MSLDDVLDLPQLGPADWGAAVDYDRWAVRHTSQAFVHWLGTPAPAAAARGDVAAEQAALRSAERYHLGKGWRGIAYDWAVGQSGTLYRLRGRGVSGGTSGDVDRDGLSNNVEGEAIVVLIGAGQSPTQEALGTLAAVLDALDPSEGVWPHRDARGISTDCPGDELTVWTRNYTPGAATMPLTDADVQRIAHATRVAVQADLAHRDSVWWRRITEDAAAARRIVETIASRLGVSPDALRRAAAEAREAAAADLEGR